MQSTIGSKGPSAFALVGSLALLASLLLMPGHPEAIVLGSFARVPLELPILVLALLWLPAAGTRALRTAAVALLGVLLVLRLLDLGSYIAFDRRFSPLVELHLLGDGWNLASGAVGRWEAGLAIAVTLGVLALLVYAAWRATGALARAAGGRRRVLTGACIAALAVGAAATLANRFAPDTARPRLASVDLVPELVERVGHMRRSVADQREFAAELAVDPVAAGAAAPGFAALAGRDVVVVFVEAYGRSALDHERFAARTRARLENVGDVVDAAGLHAVSGWLTSPIRGGRSWLAQASFASGLTVDDQARFDRLLGSDRRSVNRLFDAAGWRTAALMPAIVESWPDSGWYAFDRILDGHTSGYAGQDFGWVTMPDQYTLSAFEAQVRADPDADAPVMATIALISTHAPWTPVPRIVAWEDVGDGRIFDGTRRFGEPTTWTDPEGVRAMYAETVDYTLETLGSYLEAYAGSGFFIILGDHQPAAIVDGWGRTSDVPVHIVTADPALLARLPADAFTPGMVPADGSTRLPMGAMRELLATRFEAEAEASGRPYRRRFASTSISSSTSSPTSAFATP